jgi:manganese/zinc/iron transport system substrate-binding protein
VILIFLLMLGLASGCNSEGAGKRTERTEGRYRIVTTTGMVTDIVKQVVGDKAEVIGLLGEGVDPHLYRPTPSDVKALASADVVLYSGLHLEGRMQETFEQVKRRGREVHAVTDSLDRSRLNAPPQFAGHYDPHVWMDVNMWSECVEHVAHVLGEYDPPNQQYYADNAARYRQELTKLDEYIHKIIASIPKEHRYLVTAHDAFEYFSRAYDIPVRSAQGVSTESEPGVNDINGLVDFLVENRIRAIFVETSVSEANLRAVVEGARDKGWKVEIGGLLFSDAMGAPGTYEGTYVGMLDHNATVIARASGGDAPERGMQGKLKKPSP